MIGGSIPVVEVPPGLPCLTLKELAYLLLVAGNMVAHCEVHDVPGFENYNSQYYQTYQKGHDAMHYCSSYLWQEGYNPHSSGARGKPGLR